MASISPEAQCCHVVSFTSVPSGAPSGGTANSLLHNVPNSSLSNRFNKYNSKIVHPYQIQVTKARWNIDSKIPPDKHLQANLVSYTARELVNIQICLVNLWELGYEIFNETCPVLPLFNSDIMLIMYRVDSSAQLVWWLSGPRCWYQFLGQLWCDPH